MSELVSVSVPRRSCGGIDEAWMVPNSRDRVAIRRAQSCALATVGLQVETFRTERAHLGDCRFAECGAATADDD